jgi:hypothetical protein
MRELELRPVDGEDEAFLLDTVRVRLPSERATALLARCLVGVDDGERAARSLTVGDREALLLQLRRLTFGDTLECVLHCPFDGCGEQMQIELAVGELLVPPYGEVRREHEERVETEVGTYEIKFRLPTALDLDRAALARSDPDAGALELLRRCVHHAEKGHGSVEIDELPDEARSAIASAMRESDPQAELELDLTCPACDGAFSVVLDAAAFFLQELDERAAQLFREVHVLASHYHWEECEILRMPASRRERYLELIAESAVRGKTG